MLRLSAHRKTIIRSASNACDLAEWLVECIASDTETPNVHPTDNQIHLANIINHAIYKDKTPKANKNV